ncbi:hypothetical protein CFP56_004715 [Quercus suber]|uniref:Uncharacterized protein n=1 Tax=Quercus suber TaxID=58331 RepID=A0AAW0M6Y9_QUESU
MCFVVQKQIDADALLMMLLSNKRRFSLTAGWLDFVGCKFVISNCDRHGSGYGFVISDCDRRGRGSLGCGFVISDCDRHGRGSLGCGFMTSDCDRHGSLGCGSRS